MNWKRRQVVYYCICLFIILANFASVSIPADRGMVSIKRVDIPLYEPGQKAIICWDGTEELLILSTDVRAEEPTKVLEIMPLPSVPTIKTCNESIFEELKDLVEWYAQPERKAGGSNGYKSDAAEPPEVEIIFHEKLGVHNITVIKAYTSDGFASWVNNFLEEVGVSPMSFPEAESIASSYMNRGINYFVLDIIELTKDLHSPEPLMFRFNSTSVYYPMEITTLTGGESHIILFIVTPYEVIGESYTEVDEDSFGRTEITWEKQQCIEVKKPDSPVDFYKITTTSISPNRFEYNPDLRELYSFFKSYVQVKIGVYEYDGTVELKGDINISEFSTETVKLDEDYTSYRPNFCFVFLTVPAVVIIFLISCTSSINQKPSNGKKR